MTPEDRAAIRLRAIKVCLRSGHGRPLPCLDCELVAAVAQEREAIACEVETALNGLTDKSDEQRIFRKCLHGMAAAIRARTP